MGTGQQERIRLPGFGRPLDDYPLRCDGRFPHAIADLCMSVGILVRERRMLDFVNQITDKPEWERKVFDEDIVGKWRSEACVRNDELNDEFLSAAMFDYCIQELRDKAGFFEKSKMVSVLDCEAAIVKSDEAVSQDLSDSLRQSIRVLEDVPDDEKDWHPGSNEQVLDLLHPSLFPLIHGRSVALPYGTVPLDDCARYIGEGEVVLAKDSKYHNSRTWRNSLEEWGNFQWLPSDIHFDEDGRPKITSYVNNLHPRDHEKLYGVLDGFVSAAIPLWNECLSWFETRQRVPFRGEASEEDFFIPDEITYTPTDQEARSPKYIRPYTLKELRDYDSDHYRNIDFDDSYYDWFQQHRILIQMEPDSFRSRQVWEGQPEHKPVDLQKEFAKSGLQVIFKLANIHLTPDHPEYTGGSWHIEGALNEHICATALYYYDEHNITPSHIAFRQRLDEDELRMMPAQSEYYSLEMYYGIENDGPAIQNLGKVLTRPGRLLTFPNMIQHQVQPFKLEDPTKPGHRKILAMFLVDPHIRILSTANVPPQRKDWWAEEVRKVSPFNYLPLEIFDMIIDYVEGFPLSWEEAEEVREELMDERGAMVDDINEQLDEATFNFCEH